MPAVTPQASSEAPYGRRLIFQIIDEVAQTEPDRICYVIPLSDQTYEKGVRRITYSDMAKAVDRTAWFLESKLGKCTTFETLAYLGPSDVRYFIFVLGAAKASYKLLLPSPRNSVSNHIHLLNVTKCSIFLKPRSFNIGHILATSKSSVHVLDVPELGELLDQEPVAPYHYKLLFEDAANNPFIVLHSSGSTGQAKPITLTHRAGAAFDNHHLLSHENGLTPIVDSYPEKAIQLVTMPPFHAGCIFPALLMNFYYDLPAALLPSKCPLSVATIVEALEHSESTMALFAPSVLAELTESPRALELLSKLERITYGGGALADHVGEILAKCTRLQSFIGSTEAGGYPIYVPDDYTEDAEYIRFNPAETGVEFRRHTDDSYEIVFVRHRGPAYSSIFDTFPDLNEYPTSDLFQPHPSKQGLWKHIGRVDDVIVLSTGEKVVPSIAESVLHQAPEVHDVLIFGQKRFQVAAIIEPQPSVQWLDREHLLERLDPYVTKANRLVPGHAQLSRDMIIITSPEKPMVRLPKGPVSRKATFTKYGTELDELYSDTASVQITETPLLKGVDENTTIRALLDIFSHIRGSSDLSPNQDFFNSGIDSLQVIAILRRVKAQLEAEKAEVSPTVLQASLIYSNPTINKLAKALRASGVRNGTRQHPNLRVQGMKDMLAKYIRGLPRLTNSLTVVLTGSTGSLGSYLLDALLNHSQVTKIWCLNRAVDGRTKQVQASSSRGLSIKWGDRVDFLCADLSKPRLGLDEATYHLMVSSTSIIIHSQWPVNFNLPLSSFEPYVQGVRNLINLGSSSPRQPVLLFTSTIGTAQNWSAAHPGEPVPEAFIDSPFAPSHSGYAESKWISEGLLSAAASVSGVDVRIIRVGQLVGSIDRPSVWNKDEWFPSLVASSSHLSLLPLSIGPMSKVEFVPVDRAAEILLDIAFQQPPTPRTAAVFYNLVNPHPIFLSSLLLLLAQQLKSRPKLVPYQEWVAALEASADDPNVDLDRNPAVKLLDFFKQLEADHQDSLEYSTKEAEKISPVMRQLEPVEKEWVAAWLKGWGL